MSICVWPKCSIFLHVAVEYHCFCKSFIIYCLSVTGFIFLLFLLYYNILLFPHIQIWWMKMGLQLLSGSEDVAYLMANMLICCTWSPFLLWNWKCKNLGYFISVKTVDLILKLSSCHFHPLHHVHTGVFIFSRLLDVQNQKNWLMFRPL